MMEFDQIFQKKIEEEQRNFDKNSFFSLFNSRSDDKNYRQMHYLFSYLNNMGCKSFLIESLYTDKYYLDDYLHFYGNCHQKYKKNCQRIHFFKDFFQIDTTTSKENAFYEAQRKIQDNYLGFVVIKPLEQTMIGRTLLSIYPGTNSNEINACDCDHRNIMTIHNYHANICGFDLGIKSLPFQEQDSVVSACATIALWSLLEQSTYVYGYYSPTPFEITTAAHQTFSMTRTFPSNGLILSQVITAIRTYNMEVEIEEYQDKMPDIDNFLARIYAYVRGKIPIFLGISLPGNRFHAVTITGYTLQKSPISITNIRLTGHRIKKLYMHDDNIGPFARYTIQKSSGLVPIYLNCEDRKDNNNNFEQICPISMIIPLYHKIRYPYKYIFKKICIFSNIILRKLLPDYFDKFAMKDTIEWDIYLSSVNSLKQCFLIEEFYNSISANVHQKLINGFFPRFIWRCRFLYNNEPIIEILGDATEAQTAFPFFLGIVFDETNRQNLIDAFKLAKQSSFITQNWREITEWEEIFLKF